MGEYHEKYIRGCFRTEQEYQDYIHRKILINWKKQTVKLFSDVYKMEDAIDEKGISGEVKNDFLDLFVGYAGDRRNEIENLEEKIRISEKESTAKKRKIAVQRNIALGLCTVLLVAVLFLAPRPVPATVSDTTPAAGAQQETVVTEQNYVASVNSNKYHRLTCDYAQNILEENRVYYETAADAEDAGKQPCSVCSPVNVVAAEDSFTQRYLEARERMVNLP